MITFKINKNKIHPRNLNLYLKEQEIKHEPFRVDKKNIFLTLCNEEDTHKLVYLKLSMEDNDDFIKT
jgi:hypothetical protein